MYHACGGNLAELAADFRVLLVLRMLRFLKLGRYSPGMRSLLDAIFSERRALFACMVILMGATLFSATIMHLAERTVQPDKLGTIPDAMWWAIVTLGTIGYGYVVPVTMLGRIIASVTIFTDPYCPWSWAVEPHLRRLEVEFGAQVRPSFDILHDSASDGVLRPPGIGFTSASCSAYMTMNGVISASVSAVSSQRVAR